MNIRRLVRVWLVLGCLFVASGASAQMPAAAPAPGFTRTIYVIRHGNYAPDPSTEPDGPGLTPLGIAQARLVGARLRGMPVNFTALYASTMTRAKQTAAIIHESLPAIPVQDTALLRECTPRTWRADVMKNEKPADLDAAEKQLNEAFAKFFVPAKDADQHDILVCHGNVTRYFVTKALGVDPQAWLGMSVVHCSLTIIQVTPSGAFRGFAVGDAGHITPNMQSGIGRPELQLVAP